jgi:hypothetical protein
MHKGLVKRMHLVVNWPGIRTFAAVLRLNKGYEDGHDERPSMCVCLLNHPSDSPEYYNVNLHHI